MQSRTEIPTAREVVLQAEVGGSRIQLAQQLDQDGPIDMGTALWKLYVDTDDCQAVYDKAIAAGCESVTPPQQLDRWPVTVAFVKDPDGYLIEFVQNHEGGRPSLRLSEHEARLEIFSRLLGELGLDRADEGRVVGPTAGANRATTVPSRR